MPARVSESWERRVDITGKGSFVMMEWSYVLIRVVLHETTPEKMTLNYTHIGSMSVS